MKKRKRKFLFQSRSIRFHVSIFISLSLSPPIFNLKLSTLRYGYLQRKRRGKFHFHAKKESRKKRISLPRSALTQPLPPWKSSRILFLPPEKKRINPTLLNYNRLFHDDAHLPQPILDLLSTSTIPPSPLPPPPLPTACPKPKLLLLLLLSLFLSPFSPARNVAQQRSKEASRDRKRLAEKRPRGESLESSVRREKSISRQRKRQIRLEWHAVHRSVDGRWSGVQQWRSRRSVRVQTPTAFSFVVWLEIRRI